LFVFAATHRSPPSKRSTFIFLLSIEGGHFKDEQGFASFHKRDANRRLREQLQVPGPANPATTNGIVRLGVVFSSCRRIVTAPGFQNKTQQNSACRHLTPREQRGYDTLNAPESQYQ
jgi:hypothetical protein